MFDLLDEIETFERAYRSGRYHSRKSESAASEQALAIRKTPLELGKTLTPSYFYVMERLAFERATNEKAKA